MEFIFDKVDNILYKRTDCEDVCKIFFRGQSIE